MEPAEEQGDDSLNIPPMGKFSNLMFSSSHNLKLYNSRHIITDSDQVITTNSQLSLNVQTKIATHTFSLTKNLLKLLL